MGQANSTLRLMVASGGCSGYSYEFSLVTDPKEDDHVVNDERGARLVVDEISMNFLDGCEIDYVSEMIRSSFQVVENDLMTDKCSCGTSFNMGFRDLELANVGSRWT